MSSILVCVKNRRVHKNIDGRGAGALVFLSPFLISIKTYTAIVIVKKEKLMGRKFCVNTCPRLFILSDVKVWM